MGTEYAQLKASLERQVDLLVGERSRFGAQFSDQALHYEREIARLQRQAAGEATSVIALQAQLHDVSELAKRNFETASALQKELASDISGRQAHPNKCRLWAINYINLRTMFP